MNNHTQPTTVNGYRPIGKHCLISIRNVAHTNILERFETLQPLFDKIVEVCDLHVVSIAGYQFNPVGATYVYVLAESHMSIHTYPETNSAYMDIFCCNLSFNENSAFEIIKAFFKTNTIETTVLYR
jgi:S-adenosylmethionine decarboxylase